MNKVLQEKDYFMSSDISLCSTLSFFGYQIEMIDKQNPAKAVFWIKRDGKLDDLIKLYFAHQLKVEPLSFFNFLKEIKTRIYHT